MQVKIIHQYPCFIHWNNSECLLETGNYAIGDKDPLARLETFITIMSLYNIYPKHVSTSTYTYTWPMPVFLYIC